MKKILLATICTILISCNSSENKIDDKTLQIIKEKGYTFKTDVFCGDSNNFLDWDVSGDVVDETEFKEYYVRTKAETNDSDYSKSLSLDELKSKYSSYWDVIGGSCGSGNKYFLLYYEGKYRCGNSTEIKKDTLMYIIKNNGDEEYIEAYLTDGP
jgi:hypothetical protein